jgi:hypothetical protein
MSQQEKMTISVTGPENPFCLEPISVPSHFFGRSGEIQRALSFLHRLQCVSIVGSSKIGKTSFLSHVVHSQVRADRKVAEGHVFVHLDSHRLAGLDADACYLYVGKQIARRIVESTTAVDKEIGVWLENAIRGADVQNGYSQLLTLFDSIVDSDLKLVVVLDDVDLVDENYRLGDMFDSALRSLHTNYNLAYLLASEKPLYKLGRICPDGPGSPFFNIFQEIRLGPFKDEESHELVDTLLGRSRVAFPESVIDCILELGDNEPHRLQRAGYLAFQMRQENQKAWLKGFCKRIRQRLEEPWT